MARPFSIAPNTSLAEAPPAESSPVEPLRALRAVRLAYEYLVFYSLLVAFVASGLIWSLIATLLRALLPAARSEPIGQWLIMVACRMFVALMRATGIVRCDLRALDELRVGPRVIIAPNHPSLIDAVLVLSRLPGVVCTAKPEIWDNPVLGALVRLAGYVRNRTPVALVRQGIEHVRSGRHLLVFPEGTRSEGAPVGQFTGGFALIAKRSAAIVQTVFIETNTRFLGKGWPLLKKPEFPLVYRVRLGRRYVVNSDVRQIVPKLHEYYRQELAAANR